MYLKRLTLCGFKSFADRIDFDFGSGITCVVGPNGCGKSNIVDAVKWVLGEQSARSLRGTQMMDMIFNGSGTRKPSGYAQVDLLFDNLDGTLTTDQTEVLITRKLYRSGESEYLINKQTCRRKDIRELFMDTGIGTNAYSVIEQGKVAMILDANPIQRRIIFEEAAGISKYKARKKEALRKLERVGQNLLRAQDILQEVEKRLRSVKYQAGKARSYQEHSQRLRELRASFSLAEYHRLSQKLDSLGGEVDDHNDRAVELRAEIGRSEAEQADLDSRSVDLDRRISALDGQHLTVQSELTANQERIAQSRQRIAEQQQTREGAQRRLAQEKQRADQLAGQIAAAENALTEMDARVSEQRKRIADLTERDTETARQLAAGQGRIEEEKAAIFELHRQVAQRNNECAALEAEQRSLVGQKQRLDDRRDEVRRQSDSLRAERDTFALRAGWIDELLRIETEKLEDKKSQAARIDATRTRLNEELAAAKEARSALDSRRQVLEDLQEKMEGVHAGVREVLRLRRQQPGTEAGLETAPGFASVAGIVADLFETDVQHAAVIEAALGDLDQHLVVTDSADYLADIDAFGQFPGRVQAIALDRLGPHMNPRDFSEQPGFVGLAVDLVRFEERYEHLARHLLGKVVIVESLRDAIALSDLDTSGHRFVTVEGQIVEPDGRIVVGPPRSTAGLISRKSQLREIENQLAEIDQDVAYLHEQLSRTSAEAAHLDEIQQGLRGSIYEANTVRVETNAALQQIAEALRRLSEEHPLLVGEAESIDRQLAEGRRRAEENRAIIARLEEQNVARETAVRDLQAETDRLLAVRNTLAEELTGARVEAGSLNEKRAAAASRVHSDRESHAAATAALADAERQADECNLRLQQAERAVLQAEARLAELYLEKENLARDTFQLRNERERGRHRLDEIAADLKRCRAELEEIEARLHEAQMQLQEANVRRDELCTRVRGELDIDLAKVYASYEHQEQDWQSVENEISELRQKIERLGNVNFEAINEQTELEERHDFLQSQVDDLTNSQTQLENLIERLNKECKTRFVSTFEDVRVHFQELFKKLFGGGKADVVLEDPDDVLESGIEIIVRPPGKELQSITLLSGGEKSMTCIALLLAVFRSRPSPFTILDEVDAALDEANNDRFNRIIREFLEMSQFILITHSKRTMTIADVMYGITMQEAGVSQRVSVKFGEAQTAETAHAVA